MTTNDDDGDSDVLTWYYIWTGTRLLLLFYYSIFSDIVHMDDLIVIPHIIACHVLYYPSLSSSLSNHAEK